MVQYHKRSRSKSSGSGGMRRSASDKRKAHWGGFFAHARVSEKAQVKSFRVRGGRNKAAVASAQYANVSDAGKVQKTRILSVKASPDNRHFARENVLTRGATIETDAGLARVTSRPGQDGVVNAVLLEKPKA